MTEDEYIARVVEELNTPDDFDMRLYRATANWIKGPVLEHVNKEKLNLGTKSLWKWRSLVTGNTFDGMDTCERRYANIDEKKNGRIPLPKDEYPYTMDFTEVITEFPISPESLRTLICYVEFTDLISFNVAKEKVFPEMIKNPGEHPWDIMERLELIQNNNEDEIKKLAIEIVAKFPEKATEYKNGKVGLLGFFTGELIRAAGKGKVNPKVANEILKEIL